MPTRKPLQRQVRREMQMVLICLISILVTGSHITQVKNIEHVYYYICIYNKGNISLSYSHCFDLSI